MLKFIGSRAPQIAQGRKHDIIIVNLIINYHISSGIEQRVIYLLW